MELSKFNRDNLVNDNLLEELIYKKFSDENKELLKLNFSIYLAYKNNKDNEFIIELDDIYKWLGFTRKDNAKRLLVKEFPKDIDYIIRVYNKNTLGGRPKEQILLTIKCFKKFCFKANTSEAEKIYDYYIQLEEVINEYFEQKYINSNLIIENQIKIIKEKDKIIDKLKQLNKKGFVYILSTDKANIYKCGKAINVINRKNNLQTGIVDNIEILYTFKCINASLLENIVHIILNKYRCSKREHFNYDLLDKSLLRKIIINLIFYCKNTGITYKFLLKFLLLF